MISALRLSRWLLPALALAGLTAARAADSADAIIAKARAALGTEAALNSVQSIHYVGTLDVHQDTPKGPEDQKFSIDIIVQKPGLRRIISTGSGMIDTTALSDYTGWHRMVETEGQKRTNLSVITGTDLARLRASTWESLEFYLAAAHHYGRTELLGAGTVDSAPAVKVAFVFSPGIVFARYFDPNTGKLILTETDQGQSIRQEGELVVNGIHFPQKEITTTRYTDAQGKIYERKLVVTFDKITCNEKFPAGDFEFPIASLSNAPAK
jgi:outer membrane lipoprotein-sorting protein